MKDLDGSTNIHTHTYTSTHSHKDIFNRNNAHEGHTNISKRTHFYIYYFMYSSIIIVEDVIRSEYDTGTSQRFRWQPSSAKNFIDVLQNDDGSVTSNFNVTLDAQALYFPHSISVTYFSTRIHVYLIQVMLLFFPDVVLFGLCLFLFFVPILSNLIPFIYAMKMALKCPLRHHFIGAIVCTNIGKNSALHTVFRLK